MLAADAIEYAELELYLTSVRQRQADERARHPPLSAWPRRRARPAGSAPLMEVTRRDLLKVAGLAPRPV